MEVAGLLRSTFREADLVARLGGDEFTVLVPRHGTEAKAGLERLRHGVGARKGRFPPVALSIGMSTYDGEGPCSIEDLIDRADAAMTPRRRCAACSEGPARYRLVLSGGTWEGSGSAAAGPSAVLLGPVTGPSRV